MRGMRKQQLTYASITLIGVVVLAFQLQAHGVAWWWAAALVVVGGLAVLAVVRALDKAVRCPQCDLILNETMASLEKQGAPLAHCPSCGCALGANHSLQARLP